MKLVIGYFYPQLLNLYGDDGNVQILKSRAQQRNIDVEVIEIGLNTSVADLPKDLNLLFMGGGPDSGQKEVYDDLFNDKKAFLKNYVENNGVGLFICGAYQLLGNYYKSSDGEILKGIEIFNVYTEHFGNHKPRCIGNVVCKINSKLLNEPAFSENNFTGDTLVGFENHGGRTYLSSGIQPLAHVKVGHGNNSEDGLEGSLYKKALGTYLHGPILSRNPHLADYLIAGALKITKLDPLEDTLINSAHTASLSLKQ